MEGRPPSAPVLCALEGHGAAPLPRALDAELANSCENSEGRLTPDLDPDGPCMAAFAAALAETGCASEKCQAHLRRLAERSFECSTETDEASCAAKSVPCAGARQGARATAATIALALAAVAVLGAA